LVWGAGFATIHGAPRLAARCERLADLVQYVGEARRVAAWNPPDLRSLEGVPLSQVWGNTGAPYALAAGVFNEMLKSELQHLEPYNCARYRLPIGKTQEWIDRGRPQ